MISCKPLHDCRCFRQPSATFGRRTFCNISPPTPLQAVLILSSSCGRSQGVRSGEPIRTHPYERPMTHGTRCSGSLSLAWRSAKARRLVEKRHQQGHSSPEVVAQPTPVGPVATVVYVCKPLIHTSIHCTRNIRSKQS